MDNNTGCNGVSASIRQFFLGSPLPLKNTFLGARDWRQLSFVNQQRCCKAALAIHAGASVEKIVKIANFNTSPNQGVIVGRILLWGVSFLLMVSLEIAVAVVKHFYNWLSSCVEQVANVSKAKGEGYALLLATLYVLYFALIAILLVHYMGPGLAFLWFLDSPVGLALQIILWSPVGTNLLVAVWNGLTMCNQQACAIATIGTSKDFLLLGKGWFMHLFSFDKSNENRINDWNKKDELTLDDSFKENAVSDERLVDRLQYCLEVREVIKKIKNKQLPKNWQPAKYKNWEYLLKNR